jgi:hypothetical protein
MTESFLSQFDLLSRPALMPLLDLLDRLGVDRRDLTLTEEDLAGGRCRRLRGFVGGALRTGSDG